MAAWLATVDQLWTEAGPTWHGRESARPLIGIIAVFAGDGCADHRLGELVAPEYDGLPVLPVSSAGPKVPRGELAVIWDLAAVINVCSWWALWCVELGRACVVPELAHCL